MKRMISVIISAALLLSMAGCGKVPAVEPVPSTEPESVPVSQAEVYCMELDYGRLYLQGKDELEYPTLTVDSTCLAYSHYGNEVIAAFSDHTVRRFDLTDGSSEVLMENVEGYIPRLQHYCQDGFIYIIYDMYRGSDVYRWHKGESRQIVEKSSAIFDLYLSDNALLYREYSSETDTTDLIALNISDGTERWRVTPEDDAFSIAYQQDDTVYIADGKQRLYRAEMSDGSLEAVDIAFDPQRFDILAIGSNGSFLLNDYGHLSRQPGVYYANADGIRLLDYIPTEMGSSYAIKLDRVGDRVLVRSMQSSDAPEPNSYGENYGYNLYFYHVVDMTNGSCQTMFVPCSENARMFEFGDFPILDSSTARKPVAWSIYCLFCEGGAITGTTPVCNTTHGAWLAIADKTSDIALLAAPTEEEQAYLAEKGVNVEMKLYGGDGLVFIGNKKCGVENLTLDDVRGIYSGQITNWSELGGVDAPIHVLYRDDQSGSQRLFERMVWGTEEIPHFADLGFEQLDEMSSIVNECLYDPYSIGYSIMTYLNDVYGEEDLLAFHLNGVEAKAENVENDTYPLSTKGYVVIRTDEAQDSPARRLYNWFGSPICDEILIGHGVTPIHE